MSQIYKNISGGGGGGDLNTLTGDSGGAVSPDAGGNINVLGQPDINVNGNATPNTLTLTDLTKITSFTVDGSETAGTEVAYSTIQSAVNAANVAGGGIVYIRPGTYIENLTLFGNTELVGTPGNSDAGTAGNTVIITGVHTPPATGSFTAANIRFHSATDIFNSAVAGSSAIVLINVFIQITNGFLFNLPNWTGTFVTYNVGEGSTNNGMVNNTAGATCFFVSATHGAGSGQTMVTSGPVIMQEVDFNCPWNAQSGTTIACDYIIFTQSVTASNNSTGSFVNSRWTTGANTPFTMNSSSSLNLYNNVIDSSANPVLAGTGLGNLNLLNNTFVNGQQLGVAVISPNVTHLVRGSGQTVDVGTADLLTYSLRNVAAVYSFEALVSGMSLVGSAAGFQLTGVVKTNGATATIVGTIDQIGNADLAIAGANVTGVVTANNFIIRATGSLGSVINWNVNWTFKQITN